MDFSNKINFATTFSGKQKLGFRVYPMNCPTLNDDYYHPVKCDPASATHYSIFCLVQQGHLVIEEWIADLETFALAEQLRGLLCSICGLDNCRLLTSALLLEMKPGEVIGTGTCVNARIAEGPLRWVAVRGVGMHDWCIYYHMQSMSISFIKENGEKLCTESIIRGLIPCDQEAWNLYRK